MRALFSIFLCFFVVTSVFAQAPNTMSYQTVIRNSSNGLVTNKAVGIKISVLQGSSSGTAVFVETHSPTTNANGLASMEIGGGTASTGTFAGIDWSKGPYFIKTETDPNGGTNYSIIGTSQLLSVPYAMMANNAVSANGLSANATGVVRSINNSGGNITLQGGGGTTITKAGDIITISSSGGSGGTGIQGVQNTDGIVQITNPNGPTATLNINNTSITAAKLAAGVIPTTLPPSGAAGGDLSGTYPNPTISNGAVTAAKLAAGVIPTTLPPSGAAGGDLSGTYPNPTVGKLQGRDIASTAPTTGQSLIWSGTQWAPTTPIGGWSLTGNSGTTPATNFLGTVDNQPLVLRANNVEQMRILPSGLIGIGVQNPSAPLTVKPDANGQAIGLTLPNGNPGWQIFSNTDGLNFCQQGLGCDRLFISNTGNVGIGTATPSSTLDVQTSGNGLTVNNPATTGATRTKVSFNSNSGAATAYTSYVYTGVAAWSTGINNSSLDFILSRGETDLNTPRMVCKWSTGNVGIGTTAPTSLLTVNGTADKPGGGSWATFSDARLKQDVRAYSPGLSDVLKITPVTYHYNETSGLDSKPEYIGVLAQELQKVAPYMVSTFIKDNTEYLKVDNSGMTYMLVNAVKELSQQNQDAQKQNAALEKQNTELKKRLDALTAQIKIIEETLQNSGVRIKE